METRTLRLVLGVSVVIAVAQIAALVSVERRMGALEGAYVDMSRRAIRAESVAFRPEPRAEHRAAPPSEGFIDLAEAYEACGTHAAEVAASICDGTAPAQRAAIEPAEPSPERTIDPARAADARAAAEALVARATSSGRWTLSSREQLRTALEQLPQEEATRYHSRVLTLLNRGEIDMEEAMFPL